MATKATKVIMETASNEEKLEQFIKNNNLTFAEGSRNTDAVVISGYALHIGVKNVSEIENVIEKSVSTRGWEYAVELQRVFDYAQYNNYGDWWTMEGAKTMYKF
jgi:hypothetical protein